MNAKPSANPNDADGREFQTHSHGQTVALGRALGRRLHQGIVLLLFGDLGSGKTAFTQGLARGLEVPASFIVTSPTYTLINEYPGRVPLYHVDLYRLPAPVDPDEYNQKHISSAVVAATSHSGDAAFNRANMDAGSFSSAPDTSKPRQ